MSLLDFIPGVSIIKAVLNPLQAITTSIVEWQSKKLDAKTEQERIAAEENISTLQARRDVMVAESGSKINMLVRAGLAFPVVFLMWKVLIYDKALGQWTDGHTDALDPNLWLVVMTIIGFYTIDTISKRFFK